MIIRINTQPPLLCLFRDISEVQDADRPVQKTKKRCFKCNCKLELALREIGRCKCGELAYN